MSRPGPVLVVVDEDSREGAAARFGREHAARTEAGLRILDAHLDDRLTALATAGQAGRRRGGAGRGGVSARLVDASCAASMLVLPRCDTSLRRHEADIDLALALLSLSTCPVVVLPETLPDPGGTPDRVVVAFDGEPHGDGAVGQGAELASSTGAPLFVMRVLPGPAQHASRATAGTALAGERDRMLTRARRLIGGDALAVDGEVVLGEPDQVLRQRSGTGDWLVLGARKRSGPPVWSTGRLVSSLVRDLPGVLVVAR